MTRTTTKIHAPFGMAFLLQIEATLHVLERRVVIEPGYIASALQKLDEHVSHKGTTLGFHARLDLTSPWRSCWQKMAINLSRSDPMMPDEDVMYYPRRDVSMVVHETPRGDGYDDEIPKIRFSILADKPERNEIGGISEFCKKLMNTEDVLRRDLKKVFPRQKIIAFAIFY